MTQQSNPHDLEASVLLWIARLPLLQAGDLCWLTNESLQEVRRALDVLRRHGWIERICMQSPEYTKDLELHLLRDAAVPQFARAFGLDDAVVRLHWPVERRDLLERIAAVEITVDVNDLLAFIVTTGLDRNIGVADLRFLPRPRRGAACWWPRFMEAYGCLGSSEHGYAQFFLAWDRPGAPPEHRTARVRSWYQARASARDVSHWPPILLVCPSEAHERQWASALQRVAEHRDGEPLEVVAIRADDASSEDALLGEHWHRPGVPFGTSFFQMLRRTNASLPVPVPGPVRHDLLDRGADLGPSLHEWAERLLSSGKGSDHERVAALSLTLDRLSKKALDCLARHPYLTEQELAVLLGVHHTRMPQILGEIQQHGLISSLGRDVS